MPYGGPVGDAAAAVDIASVMELAEVVGQKRIALVVAEVVVLRRQPKMVAEEEQSSSVEGVGYSSPQVVAMV